MATWTPPADAVETEQDWTPPVDAAVGVVLPQATTPDAGQQTPVSPMPTETPWYQIGTPQQFNERARSPGVLANIPGAIAEPIMKMGSGIVAKPVSEVMGIAAMFSDFLGNKGGDPSGFKKSIAESLTYQPRTTAGKSDYNPLNAIPELIGKGVSAVTTPIMQAVRGESTADSARGMAANFVGEAVPQALGFLGVKNAPLFAKQVSKAGPVVGEITRDLVKDRTFTKQAVRQAASDADWQRAATIEAAQKAREVGVVLNPNSVSGGKNAIRMATAGGSPHFNTAASIANKEKWNNMVREDLGLPRNGELSQLTSSTYDAVRKVIAKPYDQASTLGKLNVTDDITATIRGIEIPEILPAGEQAAGKMARVTDVVANQLERGMTGKDAVLTTRTLRKEAKSVFDTVKAGEQVDPVTLETAKAKMTIADKIDDAISQNITDPAWKKSFDDSRRKMALSYAYERATNLARRQVDPQVFAQEMGGRHRLTGNAAKMGEIAANFPEIANVYAEKGSTFGMPVRSGVAGTTGFALGSLYGSPVATSAASAGLAALGEKVMGRRLLSAAGQKKFATPADRRIFLPVTEATTKTEATMRGLLTGEQ